MPMPPSGTISMQDFRNEIGGSGPLSMDNLQVRTLCQARYSTPIVMSNAYNRALVWNFSNTSGPYVSPRAAYAETPRLYISDYFTSGMIQSGAQFTLTAQLWGGSWICGANEFVTSTFTYGSGSNQGSGGCGRKSQYQNREYDGGNSCYAYKYYGGDSTSFPECYISIIQIALVL